MDNNVVDLPAIIISKVSGKGREFVLDPPLEVKTIQDGSMIYATSQELNLLAAGETLEELKNEINMDLIYLYEEYAEAPENELTEGAKKLSEQLRKLMKLC